MIISRKPPISFNQNESSPREPLLAHMGRHPIETYDSVGRVDKEWIGALRPHPSQLVMVQQVRHMTLTEFNRLARIFHVNFARPIEIYYIRSEIHLVYEHVDLDLFEILPLAQPQIAAVMSQVMAAVHYLTQLFAFRIDAIRISSRGVVKLVLDWNFEPVTDACIREANSSYVAIYLYETMNAMEPKGHNWTPDALNLLGELKSGGLPILAVGCSHRIIQLALN
ncbi:hypothetical protein B0J13DRAFT_463264 [Dactylonectria estremocensis]|uniref:Protein kinase domain-containing protein n=1 Tax=Dactylonectria estremocensis TaxID=1079267 RepID=A0A9P9CXF1_9HYPO|nr:hypothetical protein B0J13DRAFT_463264 [Dactylonectria estremocensis]